jgi:hypothetical protein
MRSLIALLCCTLDLAGCATATAAKAQDAQPPRERLVLQSPALPAAPTPSEPDLLVAPARVVSGLNRLRIAQGSSRLLVDSTLSVVAEHAAVNVVRLGSGAEQHVVEDVTSQLSRFGLVFHRVAASALFSDQLDSALSDLSPGLLDPVMHYAGVAVQPIHPYGSDFALVVVVGE